MSKARVKMVLPLSVVIQCSPHASGMAWLRTDGDFRLFKIPIRAHWLVMESTFHELMNEVDNQTTVLMMHTHWRTRGSEDNSHKHREVL